MLDPVSVCTLSMKNNPGSYATFLGSGVSFSSKIPTGWDVIIDLISQIAILEDQKTDDPYTWYKDRYQKEPNYSDLLSQVATTPLGRQNLLQKYFEPSDEEIKQGVKTPTKAHRSIASLVKKGLIKIIVTTNFDRLMEKSLHEVNVDPIVVKSSDDVESVPPLAHLKNPLIIKLNGDYLDLRFKNTIEELSVYDSRLCSLVKDVFSNYGLIISGWSAKWDLEIVNMLKSSTCGFETFWSEPYELSANAKDLLEARKGILIKRSSDDFFPYLEEQLAKLLPEKNEPEPVVKEDTLPFFLTSFVNRPEKDKLIELLETSRMITVTGPGGGGKTRLVVEVAKTIKEKYPVHFIDFSNVNDSNTLLSTLMRYMDLKEEPGIDVLKVVINAIGNTQNYIILDNCENLVQELSKIVQTLLQNCNNLKIIVTSRQRLGIHGETVFNIGFLKYPNNFDHSSQELLKYESVQLFINRAKTLDPNIIFNDNDLTTIGKICSKLDGLPLAIILAASRIRIFNVNDLYRKLDKRFTFLSNIKDVYAEKHKTLRETISWSYDLLSDDEKIILGILNSLPTSLSIDSIGYVLEELIPGVDYYTILQELEDKSQLIVFETNKHKRFKVPETIRDFVHAEKSDTLDIDKSMDIFSKWTYKWLNDRHIECQGNIDNCIDSYDQEIDNFNYILNYLQNQHNDKYFYNVVLLLYQYWIFKGIFSYAIDKLVYILNSINLDTHDKTQIIIVLSNFYIIKGNYNEAENVLKNVDLGTLDNQQIKSYYNSMGNLHYSQGKYKDAINYFNEYTKLIDSNNEKELFKSLKTLSMISCMQGDNIAAIGFLNRILEECKNLSINQIAYVNGNIGYYYGELDDYDKAQKYHSKAMELFEQISNKPGLVASLFNLGNIDLFLQNYNKAEYYTNKCIEIAKEIDDRDSTVSAYQNLAVLSLKKGEFEKAENILLKCINDNRCIGNIRREGYLYKYLGDLYLLKNDIESALSFYSQSIEIFAKNDLINESFFVVSDLLENYQNTELPSIIDSLKLIYARFDTELCPKYQKILCNIGKPNIDAISKKIDTLDPKYKEYIFKIYYLLCNKETGK